MNENINLIDILKDASIGTKLWPPICGECELSEVDITSEDYPILVECKDDDVSFRSDGRYANYPKGECMLFPSKENRDWSTFKVPQKHKHFEAFQKVLYKSYNNPNKELIWTADFYSH